ncbi:MAG: hypothetical protein HKP43_00445 [Altererythrobacter sp.]|nr:hypothetical protein [Altererythrobacter sp.]
MQMKHWNWPGALLAAALLFGTAIAADPETSKPKIGVISASGCYFISPTEEDGKKALRLDEICDAGLDEAWEAYLGELLAEQGIYEPAPVSIDRDGIRAVLHDEPSTDPMYPPQFDLKEQLPFFAKVAADNEVDYLLLLRADGNRLNNGFWMNHSGIMRRPFGRVPVLYYSAEMILLDASNGKKIKAGPVKGPYTGDLASFPHKKLDKSMKGRGMGDFSAEERADMISELDVLAKSALKRTLPKIVRKKRRRR